jgi:hypothetical protein
LFVGHFFHPINHFSIEVLLDGDMGHSGRGRRPVPMTFAGGKPDYVTGVDLFDCATFTLDPATAGGNDEGLS